MFGAALLTNEDIRAATAGSQAAVARVLAALQVQVRMMIAARLSPVPSQLDAAEDIAQQAMLALTTGILRLENQTVGGLKSFLSVVVTRKVSDYLTQNRHIGRRPAIRSLDSTMGMLSDAGPLWQFLSASGTSPPSAAERAEQVAILMSELGALTPEYREVITLAFFDQLATDEIAQRISTSRRAASMLLLRAVQTLRRNMTNSSEVRPSHGADL